MFEEIDWEQYISRTKRRRHTLDLKRYCKFSLQTLLIAMLVVSAYFAGMATQKRLDRPVIVSQRRSYFINEHWKEKIRLPDGTEWERSTSEEPYRVK